MHLHDYKLTHPHMCYEHHGCLVPAVGQGWSDLVSEMMSELNAARHYQKEPLLIDDIREENGSLDVLVSWCGPEIQMILDDYREKSFDVCKCCGSVGNRPQDGFYAAKGKCHTCLMN